MKYSLDTARNLLALANDFDSNFKHRSATVAINTIYYIERKNEKEREKF